MLKKEKLGEGTFGIVYSGVSPTTNIKYAIKRNLIEKDISFIGSVREVDILNKLRHHPHIVRLEKVCFNEPFRLSPLIGENRDSQRDDEIHFIFKEAQYNLNKFIHKVSKDFLYIKRYMVYILLALEYIHSKRIIHRDLKPNNILVYENEADVLGQTNIIKICDFGLSKPYTYQEENSINVVTSWYRAPEITLGNPLYDYKIDIWSAGCVFYEMVTKRPFIFNANDDNDEILSVILGSLPKQLSPKKLREFVRCNKWRKVHLKPIYRTKNRKSFKEQINLSNKGYEDFKNHMGDIDLFCDLLNNMLCFEWDKRFTATQCLEHSFFNDYKDLITETRNRFTPMPFEEKPLIIYDCIERKLMYNIIREIFNNREKIGWYSDRILFQSMDLFDRYLTKCYNKSEIYTVYNIELRFISCLYLSIKYFLSESGLSYESVVSERFRNDKAKEFVRQFEASLIEDCFKYNIYRPTVYEAADEFGDVLTENEIRDLLILYGMNPTLSGMKPTELYLYYKINLKDKPLGFLLSPIEK